MATRSVTRRTSPLHLWFAAAGYVLLGNCSYAADITENPFHFGEVQPKLKPWNMLPHSRRPLDLYVDVVLEKGRYYRESAPDCLPQYFAGHLPGTVERAQASC